MALRARKTVDASALAERHAKAVQKRDQTIEEATANYAAERNSVIEVGTQRVSEIAVLQSELQRERDELTNVLQTV